MTAAELALVLLCVLAFAAFTVMLFTAQALLRVARDLDGATRSLQGETVALLRQLRVTVASAGAEVERVDALLDAAETISARVDSASRIGYVAFRAPLIRVVAFWRGITRATARLLGPSGPEPTASRISRSITRTEASGRRQSGKSGPSGPEPTASRISRSVARTEASGRRQSGSSAAKFGRRAKRVA